MKQILAMTRKEILLLAQKPGYWIMVFVVPLIFIWIVNAVFGSSGMPVVTVYAVNEDDGREGRQVLRSLRDADNLEIEVLETREEADRKVGAGERMAAVVIPQGFSTALGSNLGASVDIIIDPARSEQAAIVMGLVQSALGPIIVEAEVSRGVEAGVTRIMNSFEQSSGAPGSQEDIDKSPDTDEDESAATDLSGEATTNNETGGVEETPAAENAQEEEKNALQKFFTAALKGIISSQVQETIDNPQVQLAMVPFEGQEQARRPSLLDSLVPGYSLMFVFFLIPSLALTVIEERESGTLRRLLVAPVPRSRILLGKMLPYFLIATVQLITLLLVSKLLFGIDLGNSVLALAVIIVCSALVMSGLGILIAAVSQTEGQADGLAIVSVLSMAVISGAMFPSISIPTLQMITPHYWSMQGFINVISRGQGMEGVLLPAGILLTMAAVFFTIGAVRFRFE
jgi:ABC-2 type transport system permease protein